MRLHYKVEGALMHIWKSANIFIWKQYVKDSTLKHLLLLWARDRYGNEISVKSLFTNIQKKIEHVKN